MSETPALPPELASLQRELATIKAICVMLQPHSDAERNQIIGHAQCWVLEANREIRVQNWLAECLNQCTCPVHGRWPAAEASSVQATDGASVVKEESQK